MRKMNLAICFVSIGLAADSRAGDLASGPAPARLVNRRALLAQPAVPAYSQNGYSVTTDPAAIDASFRRRCWPKAGQGRYYESNYGATHGWGFPGGRWDPSLPRD